MMEATKSQKQRWQHGRPKLDQQAVRHVVLRLRVNATELATIQEKANEMHMPLSRWLRHPHIHILVNRITLEGKLISDSKDYYRQEQIMRRLEVE